MARAPRGDAPVGSRQPGKVATSLGLPPELYRRLHDEARRQFRSASSLAAQLLQESFGRLDEIRGAGVEPGETHGDGEPPGGGGCGR